MELCDFGSILTILYHIIVGFIVASQRCELRPRKFGQWMEEDAVDTDAHNTENQGKDEGTEKRSA